MKFVAVCAVLAVSLGAFANAAVYIEEQVYKDVAAKGKATVILHFKGPKTAQLLKEYHEVHRPMEKAVHPDVLPKMLEDNANKQQAETLEFLKGRKMAKASSGTSFKQLWMLNQMIVHDADKNLLAEFKRNGEISWIEANREYQLIDAVMEKSETEGPHILDVQGKQQEVQYGVADVGAPEVWAKGFLGQGVTVGIIDTGVRRSHEILRNNYRSKNGWFDATIPLIPLLPPLLPPINPRRKTPRDDNGHGTHCAGTILGQNGYGVAPNATWIACKALNFIGSGNNAQLRDCGQFMLCPTDENGENKDCTLAPKIVSNSWGSSGSTPFYNDIIDAWKAAGITAIFANGNSGDKCATTGSPADYEGAIGVGATNSSNMVAKFSSRGPTEAGILKPDISAPGEKIKSAGYRSDRSYSTLSGTSMAAPHVAGVAALYLSQNSSLTHDQVLALLKAGAQPTKSIGQTCGDTSDDMYPNNIVGQGKAYAPAAFN